MLKSSFWKSCMKVEYKDGYALFALFALVNFDGYLYYIDSFYQNERSSVDLSDLYPIFYCHECLAVLFVLSSLVILAITIILKDAFARIAYTLLALGVSIKFVEWVFLGLLGNIPSYMRHFSTLLLFISFILSLYRGGYVSKKAE